MVRITSPAAKIAPLMRQGFLKAIKAEIMGERTAATKGMWMYGGIQIPYKVVYKYPVNINYMRMVPIKML